MPGRNLPIPDDTGGDLGLSTASTDLFEDMLPQVMTRATPPAPQDLRHQPTSPSSLSPEMLSGGLQDRRDTIKPSHYPSGTGNANAGTSKGGLRLGDSGVGTRGLGIMDGGLTTPSEWTSYAAEPTPRPSPSGRNSYGLLVPGGSDTSSPRGPIRRSSSQSGASLSSSLSAQTLSNDFGPPSGGSQMPRSRTMLRMRNKARDRDEEANNSDSDPSSPSAPSPISSLSPRPLPPHRSSPTHNTSSPFLPPQIASSMARYVSELVICNFDLDRGPVVERRMAGRPWGKGEKSNVAFSAFPDTSLFAEGSISYSFKIRKAAEGDVTRNGTPRAGLPPLPEGSYFSNEPEGVGSSASSTTDTSESTTSSTTPAPSLPLPRTPNLGPPYRRTAPTSLSQVVICSYSHVYSHVW